jgi:transposase
MKKSRRKFTSEERVYILRHHLLEKVPVSDLYNEYSLHPTEFSTKYEYK